MRIVIPNVLVAAVYLAGCTELVPPIFEEAVPLAPPAGEQSIGPRLSTGEGGVVLLSWMERRDEGAVLRVSELGRDGWLPATDVVEDRRMFVNWADLPSVTSLGDGHWLAHWLSYSADLTYSYDVLMAHSTDSGKTWSPAISPHNDGTPTEHGFVSLFPSFGATGLVWLDGRKTENESDDPADSGMTLRSAFVSHDGTVQGEQEIDGLICDCCQTDVVVSTKGPIAVYRDRTVGEIRDIYLSRFVDGQWQPGELFWDDGWEISGCPVNGPAIAAAGDLVGVAWFTVASGVPRVHARISSDGGRTFGDPVQIAVRTTSGHVDIAAIGDSSFAVSWLEKDDDLYDIRVRSVTSAGDVSYVWKVGRTAVARNVPQMIETDGDLIFAWTDLVNEQTRLASVRMEIVHAKSEVRP